MDKARVQIVEDEGIIALSLTRKLEKLGYIITSVVPSSEEAIKKAETDMPDIILMDIAIQGDMDGIDTAAEISRRFNIPIIFMTAYADEQLLERAKITEPYGYIVKPSTDKEIHIMIKMALYKHGMEQWRKSAEYKETLLREIHHRVKNNFQIITSLLSLQSANITDRRIVNVFVDSFNRIKAMSTIHTKLYQSDDLSKLDFEEYVSELCTELVNSYDIHPSTPVLKLDVDIANIGIDVDIATPCGLIINEIVSNSMKYAFPDNAPGEIFVSFKRDDNDNYILLVGDNGVGIPKDFDLSKSRSLGMQLVHDLVKKKLKGSIEIDTTKGTVYRIIFKKSKID
ncbi:MAG: histidine kinase dimerization/phosphoacceptor domain -containing protein [Candidatus Magnetobacterium sp. LHC-1]|nr:response regulator [Nitrospirota bacterium]